MCRILGGLRAHKDCLCVSRVHLGTTELGDVYITACWASTYSKEGGMNEKWHIAMLLPIPILVSCPVSVQGVEAPDSNLLLSKACEGQLAAFVAVANAFVVRVAMISGNIGAESFFLY